MIGGVKETVAELVVKVGDLYKELVTNTVQFAELRTHTKETLDEFKRLLERLQDKLEEAEKDRIRRETELTSKINALEARLDALSEKALHAAIREEARGEARDFFERMTSSNNEDSTQNPEPSKQLPEKSQETD
ncbi:MAG: hypothetical protein J7647_17265 [Cyanobacteria bacterium SBLK]|nr:hypothetical protein [Cyanobacteria bacterium SBLK]